MSKLNLETLQPKPRVRGKRGQKFTDDEWREIAAAFARGVELAQIHEATKRFKNVKAFRSGFAWWKRGRNGQ